MEKLPGVVVVVDVVVGVVVVVTPESELEVEVERLWRDSTGRDQDLNIRTVQCTAVLS